MNRNLSHQNNQQRDLIAQYGQDFDLDIEANVSQRATSTSLTAESTSTARPMFSHPGPFPTPFCIAARSSPSLRLSFVVHSLQGETLEFGADTMDLAFVLEQTLKQRGWRDETVKRSILDFLEAPLMKVEWMGSGDVARVGRLAR
jgi:hypothetical protein